MAILLVIMSLTLGLGWRTGAAQRCWRPADLQRDDEVEITDACARSSLLVLVSLVGLLALGMTYGNVLGGDAGP